MSINFDACLFSAFVFLWIWRLASTHLFARLSIFAHASIAQPWRRGALQTARSANHRNQKHPTGGSAASLQFEITLSGIYYRMAITAMR